MSRGQTNHTPTSRESADRVLLVSASGSDLRSFVERFIQERSDDLVFDTATNPKDAQNRYFDDPSGLVLLHSEGPLVSSRELISGLLLIDPQVVILVFREALDDEGLDVLMRVGAWEVQDSALSPRALGHAFNRAITRRDLERRISQLKKTHDDDLTARTRDVLTALDASIFGLAKLVEYRDANTAFHLERLSDFSAILASQLGELEKYRNVVTQGYVNHIRRSASLHDIGKVGIPDRILMKPGRLNDEEFGIIRYHPLIGFAAIKEIQEKLGSERFFQMAMFIAKYHHERWDGGGCPEGLAGESIPLSARIVAVADVYDAMTSERPYKQAMPHEEALAYIREARGTHFDPDVVDAFLSAEADILGSVKSWREHRRTANDSVNDVLHTVRRMTPDGGLSAPKGVRTTTGLLKID
jgi:cyclic di-GMP phosphodiesterase